MKVLVCPLNWGLGHAARCVPVIRQLIGEGHEPIIVADGYPLAFLQQEFPQLAFEELLSYSIRYGSGKSQIGAMLRCLPNIIKGIWNEHRWLKKYLKTHQIDKVISDNRFGLWNKKTESVYITHQLMVKMPKGLNFAEPLVWLLHRWFISCYDECWIPDFASATENLSGDLAHKYKLPKNARFIGVLSRFQQVDASVDNSFDIVCVVSGPEPHRTIFEEQLIARFSDSTGKVLIVQGKPQSYENAKHTIGNITLIPHVVTSKLASFLLGTKQIISRSGYSTIMDLYTLNCLAKTTFHPTHGQTEQEYLAEFYSQKTAESL